MKTRLGGGSRKVKMLLKCMLLQLHVIFGCLPLKKPLKFLPENIEEAEISEALLESGKATKKKLER